MREIKLPPLGSLLDLNDHALERHSLSSGPAREQHIEALAFIWLRTIYGTGSTT